MPNDNAAQILAWEHDPGAPDGPAREPIVRPVPSLDQGRLPIEIQGQAPSPAVVERGTPEFRYWVAADALARGVEFWAALLPGEVSWPEEVGTRLVVTLDAGVKLNAEYGRASGLRFFHQEFDGATYHSGESPDIVAHELGHAILDALRPELWNVHSTEVAAFHEAFGDISALLVALELPSVREAVIAETDAELWRSSAASRLGEQLGYALRHVSPHRAESDCLRNAANEWFYRDPALLPPQAPATMLSSKPHFFGRVFTGAFLKVLAGMVAPDVDEARLLESSRHAGQLLVDAVALAPITSGYFSQLAAHMLVADSRRFDGRYRDALKFGFVRHGILALDSATGLTGEEPPARGGDDGEAAPGPPPPRTQTSLPGARYGLPDNLLVDAPVAPPRFRVSGAAADLGGVELPAADAAAEYYVEDLFRLGSVDLGSHGIAESAVAAQLAHKTHALVPQPGGLVVERRVFDCGFRSEGG
jgi:hypothetical protein